MSADDKLLPHRNAIDKIDATILNLLNQRAGHARAIGELKGTGTVYRPEREAAVLNRIQNLNHGPLPNEAVARLFREIMSECLAVERPLTISYLGPAGTFTQQAAIKHFGHAAHTQACTTIDECFRQVEARQADYLVAPVENSTEGSIGRTLDLLSVSPLQACGEVVLRIHHHLLRKNSSEKTGIKKIYAHAQALAQCHEWLNRHLPDAVRISVSSNAEAARLAAESNEAAVAAIAGQTAAELYRLTKVADNIEDEPNNTTRFLVLGHQTTTPTGRDKTSLVVSTPNKAGAVNALLKPFTEQSISMTKFESRPSRSGLWDYLFFIDIEGHKDDTKVQAALTELNDRASFVKIIGSYPTAIL
ncbi:MULTISPECIES: prephenate dehydratase [unclassified Neisseria]|uniref:prephenate dehydratase n=1 Tax=unclassified Neisseria TaxID=2623750 RepID=UPI0026654A91|nr:MULTISPECIES: prephenate dehydratase [unclassified Neisseria]MDO1510377.1 prephenate dehydratase [Neisseria sp. MVDL19-042950]MDO1516546.1 prephenate dehydratase [Neisseria sp. MVDL18-041461]MDO1563661.1 prephenate dehydratase [Neisseria sp. MVDL20-010259]